MFLEWTEDVSVGVGIVDLQHKSLFEVLNGLIVAIEGDSGEGQVESTFVFLDGYVSEHFNTEEKLMREVSCPGMETHLEQHKIFTDSVEEIKKIYKNDGPTEELLLMLKSRLCNWLFSHIMMVDRTMGPFLKAKTS